MDEDGANATEGRRRYTILGGIVSDWDLHEARPMLDIITARVNKYHLFVTCKNESHDLSSFP